MALSLVTLNVERNRHWGRILPWLAKLSPDVICVQEIFEQDLKKIENLGYHSHYAQRQVYLYDLQDTTSFTSEGVALFSKTPFVNTETLIYHKAPRLGEQRWRYDVDEYHLHHQLALAVGHIKKDNISYTIGTTHFTCSKKGEPTTWQETDMTNFLSLLPRFPSLILAGDFNIIRSQSPLYKRLTIHLHDGIPPEIAGSVDVDLHRAGKDPIEGPKMREHMIDYIFTTHHYQVKNVRQRFNLSDHCAFIADIEKVM